MNWTFRALIAPSSTAAHSVWVVDETKTSMAFDAFIGTSSLAALLPSTTICRTSIGVIRWPGSRSIARRCRGVRNVRELHANPLSSADIDVVYASPVPFIAHIQRQVNNYCSFNH